MLIIPGGFWGEAVQKGKPAELELENPMDVLVITSASLGSKVGKERHVLCCEVDGSKFVICSLTLGVSEQAPLNLRFHRQSVKFTVEGGSGEVHLTGYAEVHLPSDMEGYGMDDEDEDEEEEEDGGSEDESDDDEVRRNTLFNQITTTGVANKRKMIPITDGPSKKHKGDDDESPDDEAKQQFKEAIMKHFFGKDAEVEDDDSEYELEEEEDEEISGSGEDDEEGEGEGGSDDDDDDEDEDEEAMAKHVAFGSSGDSEDESEDEESEEEKAPKKHKHENSKVQRQQTPGKPAKKPDTTPKQSNGKAAAKTPQTDVKKVKCPSCPKTFKDNVGMKQHLSAVHKSA